MSKTVSKNIFDENEYESLPDENKVEQTSLPSEIKPIKSKKAKPHYHGHRARLRQRALEDIHKIESYELLELLLGYVKLRGDTKPIAKELLQKFGSLWGVLNAHPTELDGISDFGSSSKVFFILLRELIARYFMEPIQAKKSVTLDDIAMLAKCMLDGLPHEEVWVALLDNNNRLLGFEKIASGFIDNVTCSPRFVTEIAIAKKAKGLVLIHNHPGGVKKVSWADAEVTTNLKTVLQYMGIRLIDHLILADGKVISMAENHFF